MAHIALNRIVVCVEGLRTFLSDNHPISLFEVGDLLCQMSERQRVGAKIHLPVTVPHDKR